MVSIAAFVHFWSSAYEVSGGCATDTLYPSFLRMLATGSQPDPSAKAPCTRTTFLIGFVTTILLCSKDPLGSVDFPMSKSVVVGLLVPSRSISLQLREIHTMLLGHRVPLGMESIARKAASKLLSR